MSDNLDRAGALIDMMAKLKIEVPEVPELIRDPNRFLTLCRRCNRMIPDKIYEDHDKTCPWECGICGEMFTTQNQHAQHSMHCNGSTVQDSRSAAQDYLDKLRERAKNFGNGTRSP